MPLCTLHLLTLQPPTTPPQFLSALLNHKPTPIKPILHALPIRWIIPPAKLSPGPIPMPTTTTTTSSPPPPVSFSLLLVLPGANGLPTTTRSEESEPEPPLSHLIQSDWHVVIGIPSSVLTDFPSTQRKLLSPSSSSMIPPLTGSLAGAGEGAGQDQDQDQGPLLSKSGSTRDLELSRELLEWLLGPRAPHGPVTMLNLLAFRKGDKEEGDPSTRASEESYRRYGKAFAEDVGIRRGGVAKLVGRVVPVPVHRPSSSASSPHKPPNDLVASSPAGTEGGEEEKEEDEDPQDPEDEDPGGTHGWDEIALAHYPSTLHFADMVASRDYQDVNRRYRVHTLRDTCILCTSEVVGYDYEWDPEGGMEGRGRGMGKGSGSTTTTTTTTTTRERWRL